MFKKHRATSSQLLTMRTAKKYRYFFVALLAVVILAAPAPAQDESVDDALPSVEVLEAEDAEAGAEATIAPGDGIYFADIIVRGQSVFQVGSLDGISASQRAAGISRRIASLLDRAESDVTVSVEPTDDPNVVNVEANGRVLMTITEQDAQDLRLPLDTVVEDWVATLDRSFDKPPVAIEVIQRLDGTLRQLSRDAIASIPALLGVAIVVLFTWAIARIVRLSAFQWAQRTEGDRGTEILIGRLGYGAVWVAGAAIALGVWGIDFATVLGALGLTSVAIGFSLKDVLSNYISGVILLAARPFHIGDQVVIDGYEGTVTQVRLRATTIKTYDGRTIYIPNQEIFGASITNNTTSKYLRSSVFVGIDYDANIGAARQVIVAAISQLDRVQSTPKPEVLVSELAASTVNLEIRFWVDSHRAGFLETTSIVAQCVKEALQAYEIEMPTEIYTLLLKDVPDAMKQNGDAAGAGDREDPPQTGTLSEA